MFSDKTQVRLGLIGSAGSGYSDIFLYIRRLGPFVCVCGGGGQNFEIHFFWGGGGWEFRNMFVVRGMKIFLKLLE